MKQKPLWRISVATTLEAEDAIAELLGVQFGQSASSFFNVEKQASVVSVYLPGRILLREIREEISSGLKRIKNCGLSIGTGEIKISKIRGEDWAESWKRHFKPINIGNSLLVKPSWSKRKTRKNQVAVILDPGLSFGTGQHPTTSFCLGNIAKRRDNLRTQSFLDIGTGSGILAIAAAKLGYRPVRAFDFDPNAIRVARANARANYVLNKIKIVRYDVAELRTNPKEQFDLVCANLISNLLIEERKKIIAQLNCSGILVLAGILDSEFSRVRMKYEKSGLKLVSTKGEKEWRSGSFRFE